MQLSGSVLSGKKKERLEKRSKVGKKVVFDTALYYEVGEKPYKSSHIFVRESAARDNAMWDRKTCKRRFYNRLFLDDKGIIESIEKVDLYESFVK